MKQLDIKPLGKKGYTASGITEMIIIMICFIAAAGYMYDNLYSQYSQSWGLGNEYNTTTIQDSLTVYQDTMKENVEGGTVSLISYAGLVLETTWSIVVAIIKIIFQFITFSFIETALTQIGVPGLIPLMVRALVTIGVGWIVIKLMFRVKP